MICTSLQNKTFEQILAILEDPAVEMAEIRLDRCPLTDDQIEELFSESDTPLIATCRIAESASPEEAERRLHLAIEAGARFADLEIEAPAPLSKRFQQLCHKTGTEIIRSFHDFTGTPDIEVLQRVLARCFRYGADIAKIVTTCRDGEEAARIALVMVKAKDCPSGKMPVVIDNEFGGVIFHEACGHALEATSVAKNQSVFAGKLGQQIAAPCVSAVDDGTIENAWGSENIDDEGTPQQKRVLIENGILKSYMIDKLNARRMGMEPTGSGRRQSYKFEPTSRMSNTFICAGKDKFEDLFVGIEKGLYAKKMGGGSVNPMTGEFNFAVNEGYMIENGKITYPVKGASLIGNGRDILMNIDKVASNLGRGQGMCGSASGSIPTDVGQPAIRVTSITVGGTANE